MDVLLNIDNAYFDGMVKQIYPSELQLNKANSSDTKAPDSGFIFDYYRCFFLSYKIDDKSDDFDFDVVNVPFLYGDIPRATSYGVFISQLIRFARVSIHVADFNARKHILTAILLKQGFRYHKLRFQTSIDVTMTWFQNLIRGSNLFLIKTYRNLNFMAT